jgi:TonB family protein
MKKIISISFLLLVGGSGFGQTKSKGTIKAGSINLEYIFLNEEREEIIWTTEHMDLAEFYDGRDSLEKFIYSNIKYPKQAIKDSLEGTVMYYFTINEQGQIEDIDLVKGIRNDLNEQCYNMLKKMPTWKPAKVDFKPVAMKFMIPIKFLLKKKN